MVSPSDIAKYFLLKTTEDGELISPLKMQKLVYYAYVWCLVNTGEKIFDEQIEAWANGPVVPSLYQELKKYGSAPINAMEYTGIQSSEQGDAFIKQFETTILQCLSEVYNKYQTMTAFELVLATHSEQPWIEARKGLAPHEKSSNPILDQNIISSYSAG